MNKGLDFCEYFKSKYMKTKVYSDYLKNKLCRSKWIKIIVLL